MIALLSLNDEGAEETTDRTTPPLKIISEADAWKIEYATASAADAALR